MPITDQHVQSTEYWYTAVTGLGTPSAYEVAFLGAGVDPTDGPPSDWTAAELITDDQSPEWAEGMAANGLTEAPDYFVRILVGPFNSNTPALSVGDYQSWLRLTIGDARPVRITDAVSITQEA